MDGRCINCERDLNHVRGKSDSSQETEMSSTSHLGTASCVVAQERAIEKSYVMVHTAADMGIGGIGGPEFRMGVLGGVKSAGATDRPDRQEALLEGMHQHGITEHLHRTELLYNHGAGQLDLDAAACVHCVEAMLQVLHSEAKDLSREEARYAAVVREHAGRGPVGAAAGSHGDKGRLRQQQLNELDTAIAMKSEELRSLQELLEVSEAESHSLQRDLAELAEQARAVIKAEEEFWDELAKHELQMQAVEDECGYLLKEVEVIHKRAGELTATSALGELLRDGIEDSSGCFPSLNGYRLVRKEIAKKDLCWPEINAAWGQAALCISAVANLVQFTSSQYRIVYMGPASRIIVVPERTGDPIDVLPLHHPPRLPAVAGSAASKKQAGPVKANMDEAIMHACQMCAELQKLVLGMGMDGLLPTPEERIIDLDTSAMRDDESIKRGLRLFVNAVKWLVRLVGEPVGKHILYKEVLSEV